MSVKIYTTPTCGKCKVLKMKMDQKGIKYENKDVTDEENMNYLTEKGFMSVPVLEVEDGKLLDFVETNNWINKN